jgi:hypothetical protein
MISFGMQSGEFDRFAQYNETGVKKQQLKHATIVVSIIQVSIQVEGLD